MAATQLDIEDDDEEMEMARPPAQRQLVPRTLTGWLVALALVLCAAGLAAESSVVSEQLKLYRSHSASQFMIAGAPDTPAPLPPSSSPGSEEPPSASKARLEETQPASPALSSVQSSEASEAASSQDNASASEGSSGAPPTDTISAEAVDEPERSYTTQGVGESHKETEEASRPHPAPLLLSDYSTTTRDQALPPQVHALWIGDPGRIEQELARYLQMGFELTIHSSVDDIFEGFAPHVRAAYELAVPQVVGFDFLKLLLLYKHGGLVVDADTFPTVFAAQVTFAAECHVLFGKETHLELGQFSTPTYRRVGGNTYGLARPYQLLNWVMLAREPRNPHVAALIDSSMRHLYGRRDMEESLVQDAAGSGLISDYVALLYAEHGRDFVAAFNDPAPAASVSAVDGLCMLENELRDGWIHHNYMNSWRQPLSR